VVLEDRRRRTVKAEFKVENFNLWMLQASPNPVIADGRRRDFVLFQDTEDKENRDPFFGKTHKKMDKKTLVEHWKPKEDPNTLATQLEKCNGCELNQEKQRNICEMWIDDSKMKGSISKYINKQERNTLKVNQETL